MSQAPMAPQMPMQPVVTPVVQAPASVAQAPVVAPITPAIAVGTTEVTGEKKYKLPGKQATVTAAEFQVAINEYGEKGKELKLEKHIYPLKAGVKDYEGIQVFNCYGSYRTEEYCIKCPLRKNCIIFKG